MTLPIRVLPFWLYGGAMGPGSRQGAVPAGVRPPLRRRKVRQASFPSAAKTAPAPLLLLSPPRRARREPPLAAPKRERAAPGGREKALGRAPVQWPSALTGAGVPVPALIWTSLRARYDLL